MSWSTSFFPRFSPRREHRPSLAGHAEAALRITWLGTAGYVVATDRTTLLIDPFLSRPSLTALARKLTPDEAAIRAALPPRVDAVLCSHSHYDHLLDAPTIARWKGARLVGSATSAAFARADGVAEENLVLVPPGGLKLAIGDFEIRFVPSLHGRIFLGRVPFPGERRSAVQLPARVWQYPMGGAYGILLSTGGPTGMTLYHNGSSDLVDTELAGIVADVAIVGLAGRRATRDYTARLLGALRPSVVLPTHHDAFFAPLSEGVRLLPGIDVEGFAREVHVHRPGAAILTPLYGETVVIPRGAVRDAGLLSPS